MFSLLFKLACELKRSWFYNKNNEMTTVIRYHEITIITMIFNINLNRSGVSTGLVDWRPAIEIKYVGYLCWWRKKPLDVEWTSKPRKQCRLPRSFIWKEACNCCFSLWMEAWSEPVITVSSTYKRSNTIHVDVLWINKE